jgi:hypothetical protein
MEEALGIPAGGAAMTEYGALATYWKWHNHEIFHTLGYYWYGERRIPGFFVEGLAVANEFDPYNNDWVARYSRYTDDFYESYLSYVIGYRENDELFAVSDIMENEAWWTTFLEADGNSETKEILYYQAGIFVTYLFAEYGNEKVRELFSSLDREDDISSINNHFLETLGLELDQVEQDWLLWLDDQG